MNLLDININRTLENNIQSLIDNNRLPHAILICSGSFAQRSALAKHLASSCVCTSDKKPCGICQNCKKVSTNIHPDVSLYNPDDINEKTFKVNVIREIRDDAYIMPNEADKKIYILLQADKMNPQAQNALLKILEEPPSYAYFILECSSSSSMIDTIISRVTIFSLGADSHEINNADKEKADLLADKLARALTSPTELEFMECAGIFEKEKDLLQPVLSSLQLILRDSMAMKANSNILLTSHKETCSMLCEKFSLKVIISLIKCIDDFNINIKQNANKNLLITRFSSVLRSTAYAV